MFEPISRIISRKNLPCDKEIQALGVHKAFKRTIENNFSETISEMLKPKEFKNGLLVVNADNSVLIQEMQIKREEIISLINKELGRSLVKKLRFIL